MSNKPDEVEERFRQLEQEVYTKSPTNKEPLKRAETDQNPPNSPGITFSLSSVISWVDRQTGATKIAAIAVLGIGGFMILSFLFKLVSLAISLAIFSLVAFILYKVFFEKSPADPSA
jgi:hypothetical protein